VTVDTSGRTVSTVPLEGGHLALDFANSVGGLRDEPPSPDDEYLLTYRDFATWCARLGLISEREAGALRAVAGRDERAGQRALREAIRLRELLYGVFRPLSDGKEPPAELLARLRDAERAALADARLTRAGAAMEWSWPPPRELTDPLRPIVHAAVELLTEGPLDRLKTCGNCRWLFLDQSRNHSRRWCSMNVCGGTLKMRRYRARARRRPGTGSSA
jgi:predicted RNA-binding Zn ribbon-like protein